MIFFLQFFSYELFPFVTILSTISTFIMIWFITKCISQKKKKKKKKKQ